jgi:hypothetical protein
LESQHGEGKKEGQEESQQEEIGLNSAVAQVAAESNSETVPALQKRAQSFLEPVITRGMHVGGL